MPTVPQPVPPRRPRAGSVLAILVLALSPVTATADTWSHDPNANLPVVVSAGPQTIDALVTDVANGAVVLWNDKNPDPFSSPPLLLGLHSSHVRANGELDAAWSGAVLPGTQTNFGFDALPDSLGGALLVWSDIRNYATTGRDLYVSHLRAGGTPDPSVPVGGRVLCNAPGGQYLSTPVADGHGGMLVFWSDRRDSASLGRAAIYAGHVLANATVDPAWPVNGLLVCEAAGSRGSPAAIPDGAGGALVAWDDYRNSATTSADLYATHVLGNGTLDPAWPANGRGVIVQPYQQILPQVASDGAGGMYLTWTDFSQAPAVQHVLAGGVVDPAWPAAGVALDPTITGYEDLQISSDGGTGAIVVWDATTAGVTNSDLYAAHVLANGTFDPTWPAAPARLAPTASDKFLLGFNAPIVPSGGGVMIQWQDDRNGPVALYVDRLLPTGVLDPSWPALGRLLTPNGGSGGGAAMIPDGAGGQLYAWSDTRDSLATDWNVYADRIGLDGLRGVDSPAWSAVKDVPSDQGGHVRLEWYWSAYDNAPGDPVTGYDVWRQVPAGSGPGLAARAAPRSAAAPRPGDVRARGAGVTATFWEFLGTVPPRGTPNYAFDVPTLADSAAAGAARETFEVDANVAGTFFVSAPDSGYSVDNLAPPPPTGFSGSYAAGSASLLWDPSTAGDLGTYRLYRGTSPSFVPAAGNLVAAPLTTHYTDAAGRPYWYKLSAVDVHGNEGVAVALQPSGTTGVDDGAPPSEVSLALRSGTPARAGVTFALGMPRAGRVTLALYDAAGRRVRTLLAAGAPAGRVTATWDLRDDAGRALGDGLYFAGLDAGGTRRTQKVVVAR